MWLLGGIGGIVGGMIHFAISPDHFAEAAGQGLFFAILGTIQVGWALWHFARPSVRAWFAGIAIALASILVYVFALVATAPFSTAPEDVDYLAVLTKIVEVATIGFLVFPLLGGAGLPGRSRGKLVTGILLALLFGVVGAGAAIGLGYGAELLVPALGDPSEHHHGDSSMHAHIVPVFAKVFEPLANLAVGRFDATFHQTL